MSLADQAARSSGALFAEGTDNRSLCLAYRSALVSFEELRILR
jgi:hypothetical protein